MVYGEGPVESYEEYCEMFIGRHEASPAALKKRIVKSVDILFLQEDFRSLELIMKLLAELAQDNKHAFEKACLIRDLEGKTQEEIHTVSTFANAFFSARPKSGANKRQRTRSAKQ